MRGVAILALGVLLPGVALAEDPCDAVFLDGPEATMETDGTSYNGKQSKQRIPDGCIFASRQAILDAGISEEYFSDRMAFHGAEVIYDMPGCATWSTAKVTWSHTAGDWVVYVTTWMESNDDGSPKVHALAPEPPRELPELLSAAQAREGLATCGALREDDVPWVGYCMYSQHVCTSQFANGPDGDELQAQLDLETGEVTCSTGALVTGAAGPGGDSKGKASDDASDAGGASGCAAGQAPASVLALLLVLFTRRRWGHSTRQ